MKVQHSSRRSAAPRAAAAAAAAALAIATSGGLAACQADAPSPVPSGPASTAALPSAGASSAGASSPGAPAGTRWYVATAGPDHVIHAVQDGRDTVTARVPDGGATCVRQSITVSPDGRRLAWIEGGEVKGTLKVAKTDCSAASTVSGDVSCLGADALVWRDGDRLLAKRSSGEQVVFDLRTGAAEASGATQWQAFSADGRCWAGKTQGKTMIGDGSQQWPYTFAPPADEAEHYDGWTVRGLSPDCGHAAVGWLGTDPSRRDDSFAIIDTRSGKPAALPVTLSATAPGVVLFAADGTVLVQQAGKVAVLDAQLRKVGELPDPAGLTDATLLAYAR